MLDQRWKLIPLLGIDDGFEPRVYTYWSNDKALFFHSVRSSRLNKKCSGR